MDEIRTATGKAFSSDYVVTKDDVGQLYIRILDSTYMELASVFSNPAETARMWYGKEYYSNYTKLIGIIPDGIAFKVMLEQEA